MALAYDGKDWQGALREFLRSSTLYPKKSTTHNAAYALGKLRRFSEAVALYDILFGKYGAELTPAEALAFSRERSTWLGHVGELELDVSEPGANVVVDGVLLGKTPLDEPIKLDEGRHRLQLAKVGFVPLQFELQIAASQHRMVQTTLNRASETGTLIVRESGGRQLELFVDSVKVGRTPWQGELPIGSHLVLLVGPQRLGTPPSTTEIQTGKTTFLTLQALKLDSALRVDPTPTDAAVFVDEIAVGNGVWHGRLPTGLHHIDVIATGHLPFRQEVWLAPNQNADVRARLEHDGSNPLWKTVRQIPLRLELNGGALFAHSLSGGADDACGCRNRSHPLGFITGLRVGYLVTPRLGLELSAGYMSLSESMTRSVQAQGERDSPRFTSSDYRDHTRLRGPLAALSVSYRMLKKTPLTARVGAGVARLASETTNSGTFSGSVVNEQLNERQLISAPLGIAEAAHVLYVPFASSELRFGYQFNRVFSADFGAALTVYFPPSVARGGTDTAGSDQIRGAILATTASWSDGKQVAPGRVTLPLEKVAGPFVTLSPSVAVQARF